MGKPPKKNGFSVLLSELRREGKHTNDQDLINRADGIWRNMDPDTKQIYIDRARRLNEIERGDIGPSSYQMAPHMEELTNFLSASHSFVERQHELETIKYVMRENYVDFPFIIMSVNYFISTKDHFYPAEIGITRYSLNEGLVDNLHYFFKQTRLPPVEIPKITQHMRETHNIPFDTFEHIREDMPMERLIKRVYNYIHYQGEQRAYLFAESDDMESVRQFFEYFDHISANLNLRYRFKVVVLSLSSLYSYMDAHHKQGMLPDVAEADNAFKATFFFYYGLCKYHEMIGNRHCALGRAMNSSYLLAHYFAQPFGIIPVKGKHLPDDTIIPIN